MYKRGQSHGTSTVELIRNIDEWPAMVWYNVEVKRDKHLYEFKIY